MEIRIAAEKRFGRFALAADFAIAGKQIGIFGESGSGKSTLVGLLAGIYHPDRGEIYLDGECFFSSTKRINVPTEQRRIAMVFQHPNLFPHLSVRSNLLYGFKRCTENNRSITMESLVGVLKLENLLQRGVNHLSGGEKQRVSLGRAILANPRLLLMDEPLSALDDTLKFQIIPYLRSVSEQLQIPYLFISHSLVEMRLMADQALVVANGSIADQTTPDQLARARMGQSRVGYINLLRLTDPRRLDDLFAYHWGGGGELLISAGNDEPEALFELSSKDIILFKRHPEAISARNLLRGTVVNTFLSGNSMGVELICGDQRLVAEVTGQAVKELGIVAGCDLFVAIKASAFRRLG
jgi:molybdate transport system ATP-binding protein